MDGRTERRAVTMRARNIKPGFFSNDLLPECEPLARLLFIGLWCMADKAGRLEDRPKKIKIDVLPCDDCDIESMLRQLEKHRFIVRYSVGDARYIQVVNFEKHQNPHCKEKASTIPAPCAHGASTVHPPDTPDTRPADSLIPDMRIAARWARNAHLLADFGEADIGDAVAPGHLHHWFCPYFLVEFLALK